MESSYKAAQPVTLLFVILLSEKKYISLTCLSPISVSYFCIQFSTSVSILYFRCRQNISLSKLIVNVIISLFGGGRAYQFLGIRRTKNQNSSQNFKTLPPPQLNCCSDFRKHVTVSISLVENQVLDLIVQSQIL